LRLIFVLAILIYGSEYARCRSSSTAHTITKVTATSSLAEELVQFIERAKVPASTGAQGLLDEGLLLAG